MKDGENWSGEHYFGFLENSKHLNDPPRKRAHSARKGRMREPASPVLWYIALGLIIFDLIGIIYLIIIGA